MNKLLQICVALLLMSPGQGMANTLQALLDQGHLSIDTSLSPDSDIVPGQKVRLTVTIATDRWFSGGTRIRIPEVPGLVILQNEQFASNASDNRNGQTWVVQRWALDVFAQRGGDFTIPPLQLTVNVNSADAGDLQGELLAPAISFSALVPDALQDVDQWIAATTFKASQTFDRELDSLEVGSALQQDIIFQGSDVMAMMLPTYTAPTLPGLKAYPAPPNLEDSSNRGELSGSRHTTVTYVAEAAGEYQLPAREFFWWNTQTRELTLVTLPATSVQVTGTAAASDRTGFDKAMLLRLLLIAVGLIIVVVSGRALYPHLPRIKAWLDSAKHLLRKLRAPALPEQLNPGNSVEG